MWIEVYYNISYFDYENTQTHTHFSITSIFYSFGEWSNDRDKSIEKIFHTHTHSYLRTKTWVPSLKQKKKILQEKTFRLRIGLSETDATRVMYKFCMFFWKMACILYSIMRDVCFKANVTRARKMRQFIKKKIVLHA